MLKKIIIGHNFVLDSFAAMSRELAVALAKAGHEVVFISHRPIFENGTVDESGVTLYSWPEPRPTGVKSIQFAIKLMRQVKPDIVLAHMASENALILAAYLCGVPLRSCYYHSVFAHLSLRPQGWRHTLKHEFLMWRKNIIFGLCHKIFFPSSFVTTDFREHFRVPKNTQLVVNYNAIADKGGEIVTGRLKPSGTITLGFLGRLDALKGVMETIAALKIFVEKNPAKLRLRIAGSGELTNEVAKAIEGNPAFELVGKLPYKEIYGFISACDFLICPSHMDNLPTVCLESLMLSVPVIATRRGGIPEIVEDGKEGFLMENLQNSDFIRAFEKAVSISGDDYQQMSAAARAKFLSRFAIDKYVASMKEHLGVSN